MKAPAYHLRPNKAVDRLIFMEAIQHLEGVHPLDSYTYYGFGGPFLEDCRLIYERHPKIKIVSSNGNWRY
ncbi:MAG: O-methyltransferase [Candidatus Binataceae bacterium]